MNQLIATIRLVLNALLAGRNAYIRYQTAKVR